MGVNVPKLTSEELRKDVFAHYGAAMYYAQCMEQSMMLIIMFLDHYPRALERVKSRVEWELGIDAYWDSASKKTMGRLISHLNDLKFPTAELQKKLKTALEKRNFIAHHYFSERAIEITTDNGCEDMILELQDVQMYFQEIEVGFNRVVDELALSYGLTEEKKKLLTEEMLRAHSQAR